MTKLPLEDIRDAISGYRRCFRTSMAESSSDEYDPFVRFSRIERICSRQELDEYAKRSMVHEMLVKQALKAQRRLRR